MMFLMVFHYIVLSGVRRNWGVCFGQQEGCLRVRGRNWNLRYECMEVLRSQPLNDCGRFPRSGKPARSSHSPRGSRLSPIHNAISALVRTEASQSHNGCSKLGRSGHSIAPHISLVRSGMCCCLDGSNGCLAG